MREIRGGNEIHHEIKKKTSLIMLHISNPENPFNFMTRTLIV